jgi:hypothetical protein
MAVATTVKRVRTATNAGALATATTMPRPIYKTLGEPPAGLFNALYI